MRLALSFAVLLLGASAAHADATSALDRSPDLQLEGVPAQGLPPTLDRSPMTSPGDQRNCRGRIEAVREERGLPKLRRDNASPDEPLFIAAVERLIDGCSVLVMRSDLSDIRPLPEFEDGPGTLQPAH